MAGVALNAGGIVAKRKRKVHTVPELADQPGTYVFPVGSETAHGTRKYMGGVANPVGGNVERGDRSHQDRIRKEAAQELPGYEVVSVSDRWREHNRVGNSDMYYYDSTVRPAPIGSPHSDSSSASARAEMSGRVVSVDARAVYPQTAMGMSDAAAAATGHAARPWREPSASQQELYSSAQMGAWARGASGQSRTDPGGDPARGYTDRYQQYPYSPPAYGAGANAYTAPSSYGHNQQSYGYGQQGYGQQGHNQRGYGQQPGQSNSR
jgi:hypothetical protein